MTKITIILTMLSAQSMAFLPATAVKICMEKDYQVEISRKAFPFGLFDKRLSMAKNKCQIKIHHESYEWIKKGWVVDICREPVHIKDGIYSLDVLKKTGPCPDQNSEFCTSFQQIERIIQDDGLIFAEGEKEDFSSPHGKLYCLYALLNKYLKRGEILSRFHDPGPYHSRQKEKVTARPPGEKQAPTPSPLPMKPAEPMATEKVMEKPKEETY